MLPLFSVYQDDKSEGKKDVKSGKSEKEIESEKTIEKDEDESEKPSPTEEDKEKKKDEGEKKKEEAEFEMIDNPARVIPPQLKRLTLPSTCRYQPLKSVSSNQVNLLGKGEGGT